MSEERTQEMGKIEESRGEEKRRKRRDKKIQPNLSQKKCIKLTTLNNSNIWFTSRTKNKYKTL